MALIKTITMLSNVKVTNAYWRFNNWEDIANRQPDGSFIPWKARMRPYKSENDFKAGKHCLCQYGTYDVLVDVPVTDATANNIPAAYDALKALPDFEGASDA